jgi:UDP-2,3-diacylglucosamine pyrophosphatase LpxH
MKIALISDTHFGDPMCTLIDHHQPFYQNGYPKPGPKFKAFKEKAGESNDYLILLGDIFDFSIVDYAKAYKVAKAFFRLVKRHNIAKSIIYVPGNHDFDMWHTVEHQIRIIRQVRKGGEPKRFRLSAPGFIEGRKGREIGFRLPDIIDRVIDPERMTEEEGREKMYLNNITKNEDGSGEETNFYFAYPNLYMVTDNESIIMTHGHYLEAYWSMLGEWVVRIGRKGLGIGEDLDIKEIVAINFPLCQLACSGIGQAGPLTKVVQKVQREVKDQRLKRLPVYLRNLQRELDKELDYGRWNPIEWLSDLALRCGRRKVEKQLREYRLARQSEEFIDSRERPSKEVLRRFRSYYKASCLEIDKLNNPDDDKKPKLEIPKPKTIIFGHTHRPIAWDDPDPPRPKVGVCDSVTLYNTGGWLWRRTECGTRKFCGAAVFTYRNGCFDSHMVE